MLLPQPMELDLTAAELTLRAPPSIEELLNPLGRSGMRGSRENPFLCEDASFE